MVIAEKQLTELGDEKVTSLDNLVTIIRVNGGLFLKPKEVPEVMPRASALSSREIEILGYVARGKSNKQIANLSQISGHTVKNHLASIMWKLNANDRTHAVVIALRRGWLSI